MFKKIDEDGYDLTKRQTHNDLSVFYLLKLHPILYKVSTNQPLTREDKRIIKSLNDNRLINIKEIMDHICHEIEYHACRLDKEEYKEFINKVEGTLFQLISNKKIKDTFLSIPFHN